MLSGMPDYRLKSHSVSVSGSFWKVGVLKRESRRLSTVLVSSTSAGSSEPFGSYTATVIGVPCTKEAISRELGGQLCKPVKCFLNVALPASLLTVASALTFDRPASTMSSPSCSCCSAASSSPYSWSSTAWKLLSIFKITLGMVCWASGIND